MHIARRLSEAPGADRSGQTHGLIAAALEWGYSDGQVLGLALEHRPSQEKYGDRLTREVAREVVKLRPLHQHVGQPCDRAGCPKRPAWMTNEPEAARPEPQPSAPDHDSPTAPAWPQPPGEEAFHGIAGQFVRLVEPRTESDPVALLAQFLVSFGSLIGRGPHFRAEEWRLWTRLLVYTGCRISEFVALTWADVDLDAATLSISKRFYRGLDEPKSAYGVRTLPLTPALVRDLRRHRMASPWKADHHHVFTTSRGTMVQSSNVARRVFKPAAQRAGVPWASFHTLRHSWGTRLARLGLRPEEIQAWLGHHAASFTQDVYIGRPKTLLAVEALDLADAEG